MKTLVCIACPNGCRLEAELEGETLHVTGNRCPRGEEFALAELTHPTRTLTTTVRTAFPSVPVLPVRTDGALPRALIPAAMAALRGVVVSAPLGCGDVVVADLLSTGCAVIATSDLLKETSQLL